MKKLNTLLLVLALFASICANAQGVRYLDEVFKTVTVTPAAYGKNYTVLTVPSTGHTFGQPLAVDIYTPTGDTEAKRPLIIYLHTGNFLPTPQNGSTNGTRRDSSVVEMCTRLAKMGYVVGAATYRMGWNPVDTSQERRVNGLINAAYRGLQDARTCVRFFKEKSAAFGVDTSKIVVWGQGTGGYIALGIASLDKYSEIITTTSPKNKFIGSNQLPMVLEKIPTPGGGVLYVNSDIEGKNLGLIPPTGAVTVPPAGDTLCFPNWVNHTSDYAMTVNMGGAVGDISWIDAKTKPILSFQCPYDPFAPYKDDILFVPVPPNPLPVVQVQGAYEVQKKLTALGTNDAFKKVVAHDPYGKAGAAKNEGFPGLYPIYGTVFPSPTGLNKYDSSPWDFWAASNPNNAAGLKTNPDMSKAKATRYMDTIIGYYAPRACVVLNLPCKGIVSTEEVLPEAAVSLTTMPNPATTYVNFRTSENQPIQEVQLFDAAGRMVKVFAHINSNEYRMERGDLGTGIYIAKLQFKNGIVSKKVIFE